MTSEDRAQIERSLLMARLQIRRASAQIEAQTELELLVADVQASWMLLDGVCSRFCGSDRGFLRSRPAEREIGQVAGNPGEFMRQLRAPNRKARGPRPPRPPRDIQAQLRDERRARRAAGARSSPDAGGHSPADQ